MANTKRPALTRKTTPRSEKARKDALNAGVSIKVDGQVYTVRVGDLSAWDEKALRQELGMPFSALMEALENAPGLDLIAGLVWLARRVDGERMLSYEAVAREIGFDVDLDVAGPADDESEHKVIEGEVVGGEGSAGSS